MTHSKTPWIIRHDGSLVRIQSDLERNRRYTIASILNPSELDKANFERIIRCVNALDGIEDPEQFISDAKIVMDGKVRG